MFFALALLGGLIGCAANGGLTPQAQQVLNTAAIDGQTFCAIATGKTGTLVVGLVSSIDNKAISVINRSADFVAKACAIVDGIPVVPPAVPSAVPAVAIVPPANPAS
jgi:hypothetical protein